MPLLCLAETAFVSDHDDIVTVPIHFTLAKAVELDFIFTIAVLEDDHLDRIEAIEMKTLLNNVLNTL